MRYDLPEAQTAYLSGAGAFDDLVIETAVVAGANEVAPRADLVEPDVVKRAEAAKLRVWAWGGERQGQPARAVVAGIGGCTLDYPEGSADVRTGDG